MYRLFISAMGLALTIGLAGCATMENVGNWVAPEKEPTMAHVHIGHAMTHWKQTPEKMGLFIVAEKEAAIAFTHANLAVRTPVALGRVKQHIRHVMHAVDPKTQKSGPGLGFGLKRALAEAVSHIAFAGQSEDASENVKRFVAVFDENAVSTLERCDLILALGQDIQNADSVDEAVALADEVVVLTRANLKGVHAGSDLDAVTNSADFGLHQLRARIKAMIDRENPPYEPAPRRYLLGVVRLPSGDWTYSWRTRNDDGDGGYADGY